MLPDVNVWLAVTFESHAHHTVARSWFEQRASAEAAFCRVTMLGFLRLSQNEAAFPGEAVTADEAWSLYQTIRSDERVSFQGEPEGIDELLGDHFSRINKPSPKSVTDAYLAAFSRLSGQALYTFDKALQKHPLLK